ncbi:hypothetical protein BGZ98_000420 [Dissophora globulifera]|nr:hypothetical protein BGZ98_000420 [Dissophora globulifera]
MDIDQDPPGLPRDSTPPTPILLAPISPSSPRPSSPLDSTAQQFQEGDDTDLAASAATSNVHSRSSTVGGMSIVLPFSSHAQVSGYDYGGSLDQDREDGDGHDQDESDYDLSAMEHSDLETPKPLAIKPAYRKRPVAPVPPPRDGLIRKTGIMAAKEKQRMAERQSPLDRRIRGSIYDRPPPPALSSLQRLQDHGQLQLPPPSPQQSSLPLSSGTAASSSAASKRKSTTASAKSTPQPHKRRRKAPVVWRPTVPLASLPPSTATTTPGETPTPTPIPPSPSPSLDGTTPDPVSSASASLRSRSRSRSYAAAGFSHAQGLVMPILRDGPVETLLRQQDAYKERIAYLASRPLPLRDLQTLIQTELEQEDMALTEMAVHLHKEYLKLQLEEGVLLNMLHLIENNNTMEQRQEQEGQQSQLQPLAIEDLLTLPARMRNKRRIAKATLRARRRKEERIQARREARAASMASSASVHADTRQDAEMEDVSSPLRKAAPSRMEGMGRQQQQLQQQRQLQQLQQQTVMSNATLMERLAEHQKAYGNDEEQEESSDEEDQDHGQGHDSEDEDRMNKEADILQVYQRPGESYASRPMASSSSSSTLDLFVASDLGRPGASIAHPYTSTTGRASGRSQEKKTVEEPAQYEGEGESEREDQEEAAADEEEYDQLDEEEDEDEEDEEEEDVDEDDEDMAREALQRMLAQYGAAPP